MHIYLNEVRPLGLTVLSSRSINYLVKISVPGVRNPLMYLIGIIHETPKTINCLSCLPEVKNLSLLLNPGIGRGDSGLYLTGMPLDSVLS